MLGESTSVWTAQNPPFDVLDYLFLRLAGVTLAEAYLRHPEQPDDRIKCVVLPLREAILNLVPEAILKRDLLVISPPKKGGSEFSPVAPVALAANRLLGEPAVALGWFEKACNLTDTAKKDEKHLEGDDAADVGPPYKVAFENMLLTLAKLGRLKEATEKLEKYHDWFGRLPNYESRALEKLGLQPDVIFIRSCTRAVADEEC